MALRKKTKAERKQARNEAYGLIGKAAKAYYWDGPNMFPDTVKGMAQVVSGDLPGAVKTGENLIKRGKDYLNNVVIGTGKAALKLIPNINHPEWYGRYPELVSTNLTWGNRKQYEKFQVATGAQILITQTVPLKNQQVTQSYKDAIRAIFAKLRGSNSGAYNFSDEDVAAYLEAVRGIRMAHNACVRDIKLVNNVDPYISQTPDVMLQLAGYNATQVKDIKENRVLYINELNQIAEQLKVTAPLPPEMSVFDRSDFVSSAVFTDSKGPKSSVYIYLIDRVIGAAGSGDVDHYAFAGSSMSSKISLIRDLMDYLHQQSSLLGTTNVSDKIAGDIIRAYGERAFRPLPFLTINDKVSMVYDEYSLTQIQNANLPHVADSTVYLNISDRVYNLGNGFIFKAKIKSSTTVAGSPYLPGGKQGTADSDAFIVNTTKSDISNLEAISLTRLCAGYSVDPLGYNSQKTATLSDCGTEVCSRIAYQYYDSSNNLQTYYPLSSREGDVAGVMASFWAQVDFSPIMIVYPQTISKNFDPLIDIDTYTFMEKPQFQIFNDAAVLSLYKTIDIQDQANFKSVKR